MTSQYKKVQKVLFSHFETLKVIVKWIQCLPASYSQLVGLQEKKKKKKELSCCKTLKTEKSTILFTVTQTSKTLLEMKTH